MKKLLVVLILLVTLGACESEEADVIECDQGFELVDDTCVEISDEYNIPEDTTIYEDLAYFEYLNDINPVVTISVKDMGDITLQLFPEIAPNTVNNYIQYIEEGDFENNQFHRVVDGFMIQGGNLDTPACQIKGEMTNNGIENPLKHTKGVISMARVGGLYDSQTSQFFIVDEDASFLDNEYASFGGVTSGMNIVAYIADMQVAGSETPSEPIVITNITVDLKGQTYENRVCLGDYQLPLPDVNYEEESFINYDLLPYKDYLNDNNPVVTITVTGVGVMKLQLFPDVAPNTVNNFINLAMDGAYDGTSFERVVNELLIQGGAFETPTCTIDGEFSNNGFVNDLLHERGVISMAYQGEDYDLQSSEFFIMQEDYPSLDGKYASFGGLIRGFNVLDFIAESQSSGSHTSEYYIEIESITVELNGYIPLDTICSE